MIEELLVYQSGKSAGEAVNVSSDGVIVDNSLVEIEPDRNLARSAC